MFLVDSHCHLDRLTEYSMDSGVDRILEHALHSEVKHLLSVSTSLSGFKQLRLSVDKQNSVSVSCGVHPLELSDALDENQLYQLSNDRKVVAIGETGLDYHYQKESLLLQQKAFCQHIYVARKLKKPLIVHTRDAQKDTLAILKAEQAEECGGVLHCFSGDIAMAKALLELGFYISLSGIITFHNAGQLREVARFLPLDRLLLETDAPYLAPVPYRGKENKPAYLKNTAEYLSTLKGIELVQLAKATTENFAKLFKVNIAY